MSKQKRNELYLELSQIERFAAWIGRQADCLQEAAHHGQPVIRQILPLVYLDIIAVHLEYHEGVTDHQHPGLICRFYR